MSDFPEFELYVLRRELASLVGELREHAESLNQAWMTTHLNQEYSLPKLRRLGAIEMPFGKYADRPFRIIPVRYLDQTVGAIVPETEIVRRAREYVDECWRFMRSWRIKDDRKSFEQMIEEVNAAR